MSESKTVIISGAAAGIGKATAERFHRDGFNVVIADINEEGLKTLASDLGEGRVQYVVADMRDKSQVMALVDKTVDNNPSDQDQRVGNQLHHSSVFCDALYDRNDG